MRRVALFLFVFLLIMPLFSITLSFDNTIPDTEKILLTEYVESAVADRKDIEIKLSSYSFVDDIVSLCVEYSGKKESITCPRPLLENEIEALFFYEKELYQEGEILDYYYNSTFSSISLENRKKGSVYSLYNGEGEKEALLISAANYGGGIFFKPLFLSSPKPGMKLERGNDYFFSLHLFSSLNRDVLGSSFSIYNTSLIYPLYPVLGFSITNSYGKTGYYGFLGLKSEFNFAQIWPSVKVVRNMSLSAECDINIGSNGSFNYYASYFVSLNIYLSSHFSIGIGYNYQEGKGCGSISLGGHI